MILSIILTGVVLSWTSYTYFQKTINQDYRNIIKTSAGEISLFINNAQKNLSSLSWVLTATKLDRWKKDIALTAFNQQLEEFLAVSLVSNKGEIVATTGWEEDWLSDQKVIFKKALQGENGISQVMLTKERLPFIYMAVPVFHLGQVQEVLWGELNLKAVWDILKGIEIGKSGQIYIMDLSGRYIAHREIDRVVAPAPANKPEILKTISTSFEPVGWNETTNNTRYYCLGAYVPAFDWVVMLRQPLPEIYTYLYENIYWALSIIGALCLFAILLSWNRVKKFIAPIQALHSQVQKIGAGNLDYKIDVQTGDEIGELGEAFNNMADSLKAHIQNEIETAKELVQAKNLAVLGTTSSKVTHEVGNLLNNIGMTLTLLKRETLSDMGQNALSMLNMERTRVQAFIQNFLRFAKKPDLRLSRVSLDRIIYEVLAVHQAAAQSRGIDLIMVWPENAPQIDADASLIYQVINNLIKNSLDAMDGSGTIRIKGEVQKKHLQVLIEDSGHGIEPETAAKIFDPFFTTKGEKGTGLGLSIVKTIVETHRGTIECKSKPGHGTVFILRFSLD